MSIGLDLSADGAEGDFPVREALWPEWEPRVTGMDVVGIRLVQSKQEQRVRTWSRPPTLIYTAT